MPPEPAGTLAAVEVGRLYGIDSDRPVVIQETNNTVVWLRPHPVIAKVATAADRVDGLLREHDVAARLFALGAPVVGPLAGCAPRRSPSAQWLVTLWPRVDFDPDGEMSPGDVGASLREVYEALEGSGVAEGLPDFRRWLDRARAALADDARMSALAGPDVALLRAVLDSLVPRVEDYVFRPRSLHGEPHDGNCLVTPAGPRWIDFECVCRGPLEWDLAFLPDEARLDFCEVDEDLLDLLVTLNSARIATWCWIQPHNPEMRWHAEHHLDVVRSRWPG